MSTPVLKSNFVALFDHVRFNTAKLKSEILETEQNLFSPSRYRSGLINFGDTVSKSLFLTMNLYDMERCDEQLEKFLNIEKIMHNIVESQIT